MHIVELHDPKTGNKARILAGLGFNCFSWQVNYPEGPQELLWAEEGFETGERRPSGSGIPLLFPFPGRIGNAQFKFQDRTFLIPHDVSRAHALHGFVFDRPWRVTDQSDTKVSATFHASTDDQSILNHWPSDFTVQASYELLGNELRFEASFANSGYDDLPWGFGTHAYFRLPLASGADVGHSVLTAPVDAEWKLDDMLPTGEQAQIPADITLASGEPLGDLEFDTPYRLKPTEELVETVVADPKSGRRVVQTFDGGEYPLVVIYTPGHREAVCMEPYTCLPDPFRLEERGIASGLKVLAPGASHTTKFVLKAE